MYLNVLMIHIYFIVFLINFEKTLVLYIPWKLTITRSALAFILALLKKGYDIKVILKRTSQTTLFEPRFARVINYNAVK
jgi:hypothetical protein